MLDVLMNFAGLIVITDLDDNLFSTLLDDPIKPLITDGEGELGGRKRKLEDIITIETTTSWHARFKIDGNRYGRQAKEGGGWEAPPPRRSISVEGTDEFLR